MVAAPNEVSDIEREFLVQVYKYPYNGTVEKYKRLGLTRKKGHKVRQGLIERGLLLKKSIPTRTGQIVLMEPTAKGKELLRSMGHKINDNPAEGGAEHRYWVQKIASWYKSKGCAIEIEKKISSNEACDIEVTDTKGNKFVVEVQTSEANLEKNVRKNIEAGYEKLILFATNYKAREGIKAFSLEKPDLLEKIEIEILDWGYVE